MESSTPGQTAITACKKLWLDNLTMAWGPRDPNRKILTARGSNNVLNVSTVNDKCIYIYKCPWLKWHLMATSFQCLAYSHAGHHIATSPNKEPHKDIHVHFAPTGRIQQSQSHLGHQIFAKRHQHFQSLHGRRKANHTGFQPGAMLRTLHWVLRANS